MKSGHGITAVILAGGQGRRMDGADKGLVEFKDQPLIAHVIAAISGQVEEVVINANRNLAQYGDFGYPVVHDSMDDYQGPLAGMLAALLTVQTPYIVTVPCDGPQLPGDLVERLAAARDREQAEIAVAHDGQRLQPVYALISRHLTRSLQHYLDGGSRKIDTWYAQHRMVTVDFSDEPSTFLNVNTREERDRMEGDDSA